MQALNVTTMLAVFVYASMLIAGFAVSASAEFVYFEVQASGKGVMLDTDENPAANPWYAESKDKLDRKMLYLRYDRFNRRLFIVYFLATNSTWQSGSLIDVVESEKSVLGKLEGTPFYIEATAGGAQLFSFGPFQIRYKEKGGIVSSARMKSLATSYLQEYSKPGSGEILRYGALKMKGKMVDPDNLPAGVRALYGLAP